MDFKVQLAKDVGETVADALAKAGSSPVMEPKYDGWRCIAIREADHVRIFNRSQKEYTGKLPELEQELMKLPVGTILDGELVCMTVDGDGVMTNEFFKIHTAMRSNNTIPAQRVGIQMVAFDVIQVGDSREISQQPLNVRRDWIEAILDVTSINLVALTMQLEATQENHDALVRTGFEGTVIKDPNVAYAFGKRGHGWFKIKDVRTIDCVVTDADLDGKGQHEGKVGRMTVSQYKDGELTVVCTVNCLNDAQRAAITANPEEFIGKVLEVKIYGWDTDGPRHPTPLRFRDDKPAEDCVWSRV